MVERRLEQAAEVVEPHREQAAEESRERSRGVNDGWISQAPDCMARLLSFPQSENVLYKPLDSSLRWNDEGVDSGFLRSQRALFFLLSLYPVSTPSRINAMRLSPYRHSGAGRNPRLQDVRLHGCTPTGM